MSLNHFLSVALAGAIRWRNSDGDDAELRRQRRRELKEDMVRDMWRDLLR